MTMQDKIYVKAMEFIKDMKYEEDYIKELAKITTDPEILNELSKDASYWVRRNVADNSNTTSETLKKMAIDEEDFLVKCNIKTNPNCLEETKRYLSAVEIIKRLQRVST